MTNDLVNIIRLIRSENVGVKTFWHLISMYQNAKIALENIESLSLKGGREKPIKVFSQVEAEEEVASCKNKSIEIVSYLDPRFPKFLRDTEDAPPCIFCSGNVNLLNQDTISIVGSRNASVNGLRFAYKIAKNLSDLNKVIVSGLARGIDASAHKASLENGTIAVLAGGVDHIYPPENKELYYQIQEKGLIIAELPLGSIPKAQNFPQRNRIISGLSQATIVVEAGLKSGSLITARYALEQNREVFAVPGFPLDPKYQGNNYLLKQGAYLLESAQDVIEVLDQASIKKSMLFDNEEEFLMAPKGDLLEKELTQARIEIINLVGASPSSIDEIISITKLPAAIVLTAIVELELAGKITRHIGNKISASYDT